MLRLEELFVWHRRDLDTLSFAITDNTPISSTLRRLCFYDHSIRFPNPKWTQCCPNLTHVLIFCSSFHTLKGFLKTSLQNLGTLRCFLIAPTWNYNPTLADVPEAVFAGDRRVALVLEQFKHFDHQGQLFWLDQKDMWKELEERVSKNAHPKQVTVINSFSL
ncbi:hypothetical protein DL96DRAFT_1627269 [Flagelloscypha sp. PMI_526]|nr:hypothetical protein DL96DRAFT_1627269 [Flagelloscypha sp. PMI_526]